MESKKKKVLATILMIVLAVTIIFFFLQEDISSKFQCDTCTEMGECRAKCTSFCVKNYLFYVETNAEDNGSIQCECTCKNPISAIKG